MEQMVETSLGRARMVIASEVHGGEPWEKGFERLAKDHRFYEVVTETLGEDFEFHCLLLEDRTGSLRWIQPIFLVDQDLVATAPQWIRTWAVKVRARYPRFLRMRMLMAGNAAGEGHPAGASEDWDWGLAAAAEALPRLARQNGAWLALWKDWPAQYRGHCQILRRNFHCLPSMPATRMALDFTSFEDYLQRHLSRVMRKNLRRKFKGSPALELTVVNQLSAEVDEVLELYQQVLARSALQFERLNRAFLLRLGETMPERTRFFLWRREGRLVACSICLVHEGVLYDEYLGLDYSVALEWHLYFVTFRDVLSWAIAQGLRTYCSTPLNYDPKLHLGFELAPLDLYVAGASPLIHQLMRWVLPWIQPIHAEPRLADFSNAQDLAL